jgi:superfamily II RNA helicase
MATTKTNKFTNIEIGLAEEQLSIYRQWLMDNPYDKFKDRVQFKVNEKTGATLPIVVASIESQQKNHRDTMKDYLLLLEVVERLRQAEAKKAITTRGDIEIPDIMKG